MTFQALQFFHVSQIPYQAAAFINCSVSSWIEQEFESMQNNNDKPQRLQT